MANLDTFLIKRKQLIKIQQKIAFFLTTIIAFL